MDARFGVVTISVLFNRHFGGLFNLWLVTHINTYRMTFFVYLSYSGQILSYDNIREVIKFCAREKLVLFADEVYQETVFTKDVTLHSCRKVLRDLGPEYHNFQLMSLNSASKGFYGEWVERPHYEKHCGIIICTKSYYHHLF